MYLKLFLVYVCEYYATVRFMILDSKISLPIYYSNDHDLKIVTKIFKLHLEKLK